MGAEQSNSGAAAAASGGGVSWAAHQARISSVKNAFAALKISPDEIRAAMREHGAESISVATIADADAATGAYKQLVAAMCWNQASPQFPAVVITGSCDADAVAAVKTVQMLRARARAGGAGAASLQLMCVGGGHSTHTLSDGCVAYKHTAKKCVLSADEGVLVVDAGARAGDVSAALQSTGFVLPMGTSSAPGVAGLALCGGLGHHIQHGSCSRAVLWADVVMTVANPAASDGSAATDVKVVRVHRNNGEHQDLMQCFGAGWLPAPILRLGFRLLGSRAGADHVVNMSVVDIAPRDAAKVAFVQEWIAADAALVGPSASSTLVCPGGAPVVVTMWVADLRPTATAAAPVTADLLARECDAKKAVVLKPAHVLGSGAIMRTVKAEVQSLCAVYASLDERQQAGMWSNGFLLLKAVDKAVAKVLVAAQSQANTVMIVFRNRTGESTSADADAKEPPCLAIQNAADNKYVLLVFAKHADASDAAEQTARAWIARLAIALKNAGALSEAQTASMVFDADGKRTADAQTFQPFSIGAPSKAVRQIVLDAAAKYDPTSMMKQHETFGYGGCGRVV